MTLSYEEKISLLQLARSENIGPVTIRNLITELGSASNVISELPDMVRVGKRKNNINICPKDVAEKEWNDTNAMGGMIITTDDDEYPELLKEIYDAPLTLTVLGDYSLLKKKCFAIVGSRNASMNGINITMRISSDLGRAGYVTVSGMAYGIDTAVHKASTDISCPTVAVLGSGTAVPYPSENKVLYDRILEHGAIVSEYALFEEPKKQNFPRRNRIISGLSCGVLVVEAGEKSGSLITAKCATDQNRDVFAVPGFPLDPRCEGPNMLIKQGAVLVRNASDILAEYETLFTEKRVLSSVQSKTNNSKDETGLDGKIMTALSSCPLTIDELAVSCKADPSDLIAVIGRLEIEGKIERMSGNRISRFF